MVEIARKGSKVMQALVGLISAILIGLIGTVVWDIVFNDCSQVCRVLGMTDEYSFAMPVGDGFDGRSTSNYARRLFAKHAESLEEGVQIRFEPKQTKDMLFCREFRRVSGSVAFVFGEFLEQYADCIVYLDDRPTKRRVTIKPNTNSESVWQSEKGQYWCGCSEAIIREEGNRVRPARPSVTDQ